LEWLNPVLCAKNMFQGFQMVPMGPKRQIMKFLSENKNVTGKKIEKKTFWFQKKNWEKRESLTL